jgi:deferrochelatase/peroxidase EfeB
MDAVLNNNEPINYQADDYAPLFKNLQGNIVKGHGRDHTVNLFLQFTVSGDELRTVLRRLTIEFVTSAYDQLHQRDHYTKFSIPGAMFGSLLLAAGAYKKLGYNRREVTKLFSDSEDSSGPRSLFAEGMFEARGEFHDTLGEPAEKWQPLEKAYVHRKIDALLLLADDSESFLLRRAREVMSQIEREKFAEIIAVETGHALRNKQDEGIEHFGYVDGRSQPLFLESDFRKLPNNGGLRERIGDETQSRERGKIDIWDPFAPLELALVKDPVARHKYGFGSYYVFRKLEQDVLRFSIAEQQLADKLGLEGSDRRRAGAMMVGRFRDGTPLALSATDGYLPAQANNFRYDQLDAKCEDRKVAPTDPYGLKCPFQAHIRKVNPRQNVNLEFTERTVKELAEWDRNRRIVRRGITYDDRKHPAQAYNTLENLPTGDVGLLFACFQGNLRRQFLHMQRQWASDINFMVGGEDKNQTGLDCLIGQRKQGLTILPQRWRPEYGDDGDANGQFKYDGYTKHMEACESHKTQFPINGFVRFRGGEFFFAPCRSFLLNE